MNTLTTTTKWTVKPAKPKLNPSTVVFTTEMGNAGPPVSFDASGSVTAGSVTAGSFVGNAAGTHAVIQETVSQILAKCGSAGGLKVLHILPTGSVTHLPSVQSHHQAQHSNWSKSSPARRTASEPSGARLKGDPAGLLGMSYVALAPEPVASRA